MSARLSAGARVAPKGFSRPDAPRVMAIIPVYNHAGTLRDVAAGCLGMVERVLVVDDGSSDGGANTLKGLDLHVVRHPTNLGKGAAILTAAEKALSWGMTHMVTVDADGQHDPDDIRGFIAEIEAFPRAIVVGKRDFERAHAPAPSRVGRTISNFWLRLETGISIGDAQSGFRAYPVDLFRHLKLRERGYAFEIEVLVKASWAGVELREVGISTFYPAAGERISHFRLFQDNLRLSLLNARLVMRALMPVPHRKIPGLRDGPHGGRGG